MKIKLKLLKETTADWKCRMPNHTYIFENSTMYIVGYVKEGEKIAIKFNEPKFFDKRRRTFSPAKAKDYDLSAFGV